MSDVGWIVLAGYVLVAAVAYRWNLRLWHRVIVADFAVLYDDRDYAHRSSPHLGEYVIAALCMAAWPVFVFFYLLVSALVRAVDSDVANRTPMARRWERRRDAGK